MEPVGRTLSRIGRRADRGFTLIEVMVVVVLIAVLSSMLVLVAMPGNAAMADVEAKRLAALLELASTETRASGQVIAWSSEGNGYSFWQLSDDGEWTRFPDTSIYRRRSFGGGVELRGVLVDARILPQGQRITISPYGTRSLVEATIAAGNAQVILRGGVLGRITLQRVSDGQAGGGQRAAGTRLYPG